MDERMEDWEMDGRVDIIGKWIGRWIFGKWISDKWMDE